MKLMDTFPILGHIVILPLYVMVITPGFLTSAVFVVVCVFFLHWRLNTCGHMFYHWTYPQLLFFQGAGVQREQRNLCGRGKTEGLSSLSLVSLFSRSSGDFW